MATAVFFHAHPDDEAIATGGTMALAAEAGHRVVIVFATRGEHGEPVAGVLRSGEDLADRRVEEARRAGKILGAERVEFLGYVDSGMMGEPSNDAPGSFWSADVEEAAGALADLLRAVEADVLTVYDDHGGYGHPDHIQVHRVGVRAAALAGVSRVFEATMNRDEVQRFIAEAAEAGDLPDDLAEDRDIDGETFGLPEDRLTHAVDVSSVAERKREAMLAHASQIAPDSFFVSTPLNQFVRMFGTEWYRAHGSNGRSGEFAGDLFA